MMNNYLFETCRGQFNWNKLMRKSVHLFHYFHVHYLMSYAITLNVTFDRSHPVALYQYISPK